MDDTELTQEERRILEAEAEGDDKTAKIIEAFLDSE